MTQPDPVRRHVEVRIWHRRMDSQESESILYTSSTSIILSHGSPPPSRRPASRFQSILVGSAWAPVCPVSVSATLTAAPLHRPNRCHHLRDTMLDRSPGRAHRPSRCGWIQVVGGWAFGEGKPLILCRQALRLGGHCAQTTFGPSVAWQRSLLPIGCQRGERERRSPSGLKAGQAWLVARQIWSLNCLCPFLSKPPVLVCVPGDRDKGYSILKFRTPVKLHI